MKRRILHVSDFHIWDPRDPNEHLRESFFDEYLSDLPTAFGRAGCGDPVDAIIATGDFVDRGCVKNFEHARKVLDFLAGSWNVGPEKIAVCIGNHDVERDREKVEDWVAAREGYARFCSELWNSRVSPIGNSGAVGGWIDEVLACVALDSTKSGTDRPGQFDHGDTDSVVTWIKDSQRERQGFLVICSHFPVDMFASSLASFEDSGSDWYARHIWVDAGYLRERIHKISDVPTLWLAGDIHREVYIQDGHLAFCTTGRLGVSARRPHGEIRRQATVVEVNDDADFRIWRAEFRAEGQVAHLGSWNCVEVELTKLNRPGARNMVRKGGRVARADARRADGLALIDQLYESELLRQIAEDGLYKFGRFETTANGQVSLSWVNIEALCALNAQLDPIVKRMGNWIRSRVLEEEGIAETETLLVGMDCWGAILGSQLSVKLGIPSLPVATRAEGKFGAQGETVDEDFAIMLRSCKAAVLVTDVVGTGRSLRWISDKVKEILGEYSGRLKWFAVSIICDRSQERGEVLNFLQSHGSLCVNLRMPLCQDDTLPPREVLPPEFTLY